MTIPGAKNLVMIDADEIMTNFHQIDCDPDAELPSSNTIRLIDFVCNRKTPATPGYDENEDACGNSELCLYYRWETDISCAPSAVDYWGIVYIVLVVGLKIDLGILSGESIKGLLKLLGDGAYGTVSKAFNPATNEIVAIKKMKRPFQTWSECTNLREAKSLQKLSHTNIVKLKELFRQGTELYFVFELCEGNLYDRMKSPDHPFTEERIKNVIYQTLDGLNYMHSNGFFHRDIKPENLLFKGTTVKISDFGEAREIRSMPPYTEYVSTRWYRAPEVLLRCRNYSSPIDLWGVGCIMAELYMKTPLFPGSSELDQLFKMFSVLGSPTDVSSSVSSTAGLFWPEGCQQATKLSIRFPSVSGVALETLIPSASPPAIDLIRKLLRFNPASRPTAAEALQHPYFAGFSPQYGLDASAAVGSGSSYYGRSKAHSSPFSPSTGSEKGGTFETFYSDGDSGAGGFGGASGQPPLNPTSSTGHLSGLSHHSSAHSPAPSTSASLSTSSSITGSRVRSPSPYHRSTSPSSAAQTGPGVASSPSSGTLCSSGAYMRRLSAKSTKRPPVLPQRSTSPSSFLTPFNDDVEDDLFGFGSSAMGKPSFISNPSLSSSSHNRSSSFGISNTPTPSSTSPTSTAPSPSPSLSLSLFLIFLLLFFSTERSFNYEVSGGI
eukprot:MONOS_11579.1-p1 / transcript=MONOS_11579.1 / gene=MONOS_11579 / organism=Monocercomonoides_exilis_PA203 / gene_product=CMGC / transcript_product=CMGC / location=Mono_scaffold00588:22842-25580(-) / protein_length=662 / sequence_SO=supercontig / SO=protein_coding / is_pseudo=false